MTCIELQSDVERAFANCDYLKGRRGESLIDFAHHVHRRGQSKLVAVILTSQFYLAGLEKSPQTIDRQMRISVEPKHPVMLTAFEMLKAMFCQPGERMHTVSLSSQRSARQLYSNNTIGRPVREDLGKGRERPMANLPGPAIRMGASSPMRARLYS